MSYSSSFVENVTRFFANIVKSVCDVMVELAPSSSSPTSLSTVLTKNDRLFYIGMLCVFVGVALEVDRRSGLGGGRR